jgi:hypothetical protein
MFDEINTCMVSVKNSLKKSALLRNVTTIKPATDCETRWSGKMRLADSFMKLRLFLMEISSNPMCNLKFDDTLLFMRTVGTTQMRMSEVNEVSVAMQEHCVSLAQCDSLIGHL